MTIPEIAATIGIPLAALFLLACAIDIHLELSDNKES